VRSPNGLLVTGVEGCIEQGVAGATDWGDLTGATEKVRCGDMIGAGASDRLVIGDSGTDRAER